MKEIIWEHWKKLRQNVNAQSEQFIVTLFSFLIALVILLIEIF